MVSHSKNDSWHKISDGGYFRDNYSLFGSEYIRPEDIRQGEIGNCWYLSSITALAEYPGRIESTFLNKELSAAGVYGVQMYALGVPVTVMVDDYLPLVGASGSRTRYSKVGTDGSLWGPIMEKAFAKFHGNYARIVAGDPV
jgi:calpain-15